ncbi:AraC family transcriptional regulator [Nocardia asteroides]|uniref:AraC family transcriptional regulator n=1 Tax=Nocardia asteroides TaxID=1824 RepID=UPI001E28F8DC|nr:AraC family transcriptional regulator [Nocardia asteroides]UGT61940.1 AraC family transcriptional regulator [Nocardia asteroides]
MTRTSDDAPVQRQRFATGEADLIEQMLTDMYVGTRSRIEPIDADDVFSIESGAVPGLHSARLHATTGFGADTDPIGDHIVVETFTAGRFEYDYDRGSTRVRGRAGDTVLVPAHTTQTFQAFAMEMLILRIPMTRIDDAAATHYGLHPGELRFTGFTPLNPALDRYWNSLTHQVHRDLLSAADPALAHPVLAEQTGALLATVLLAVFPHTGMTQLHRPGPGTTSPTALARAVEHLHAHPHLPITVTELARVAGVTPRALQYAFRTHHGTTPLGYHREVRLEAAHRDLLTADPAAGDTVTAIAARWGFPSSGRFAGYYQRRYGETPAQTLHS